MMLGIGRSASRRARGALLVGSVLLLAGLVAVGADAQVHARHLADDECLVRGFDTFDDVVMTGVATHDRGTGDVYQGICDTDPDGDCWAFSMNRGSRTTVLTIGLPSGQYDWFVCAWNGSARRVVANLSGGAVLYTGPGTQRAQSERILSIDDPQTPRDLRRFVDRLEGRR